MDQKDSPVPNAKGEQIEAPAAQVKRKAEAPAAQVKRKADSDDPQDCGKQVKRACGKEGRLRAPKPSVNGSNMPRLKTARSAAVELLNLEPASFPTYAAFIYKYYETFCEAPGKARVDEQVAIRWLVDLLPQNLYSHVNVDRTLNEVVAKLLQLDMAHQQPANRSGMAKALPQQQEQHSAMFQGQWQHQTFQPQLYWQFPPPSFQPLPYWQLSSQSAFQVYPDGPIQQSYSTPKYFGPPGYLQLWPPPPY
ncbi:hypothetical protein IWW37_002029 [Coemansia sp. RSA 2050]|nr:hypothetical protein IWW37_002029 [Coemansia sp. RSA 2050]